GKVEDDVPRPQLRPEPADELGPPGEVGARIRVLALAPPLRGARVLVPARAHPQRSASSRSGCLRRKRSIARVCQMVCRVTNFRSITAAYWWWTTAAGTYQRSQPALAAR